MRYLILFLPLFLLSDPLSVEQLFNVKTTKVIEKEVAYTKSYPAVIKLDQSKIVDIAPRFSGYIEKLFAKEPYQKVQRGQKLAIAYSPEVYNAKEEYLNSIKYGRDRRMLKASYLKLKLLNIPKSELKKFKNITTTALFSPIDGFILKKSVYEGSAFKKGQTLFRIASSRDFWAEAQIPQDEKRMLSQAKSFEIVQYGKRYKATNPRLLPLIDKTNALLILRLDVSSKDFEAGTFATLSIKSAPKKMLLIPRSAVIRKNGAWYAFKVGEYEGEYEPTRVEVEPFDNRYYRIIKGLSKGDVIADSAMFLLDSDAQINGLYQEEQ